MTKTIYLERNSKGFEGDEFVAKEFEKLIDQFNIHVVIELGSFLGFTAKRLSQMVKEVYTVELRKDYFLHAKENLKDCANVKISNFDSVAILPNLLKVNQNKNILIFIDSHWAKVCPLLQELDIIQKSGLKPVIVIHDFKVPNRPELKYCTYDGQDFTFEYIQSRIESIYGKDAFDYHYNGESTGAMCGLIYVYPK